ncbi:hypothetical protein [Alcaligenes sp. WGS1538]|uniref:hypothetical protein n=1 Tax=Alcaligenes sp. WGS1538 TaxID=3366811 RepID=UPI00372D703A
MPILVLLPLITLLAIVLAWRTQGANRALSLIIAAAGLGASVWYMQGIPAL